MARPITPSQAIQSRADKPASGRDFTVSIEAIGWVRTFLGGPAEGTQTFAEPAQPGDTLRDVLQRLSKRFPKLDDALWDENDRTQIGGHIEIIVNDAILGVDSTLDSPVHTGDTVLLMGQYIGG